MQVCSKGIKNLPDNFYLTANSRFHLGTHVLDKDWDVLVILDTCRVDALRTVSPVYDFIDTVDSIWSLGGTSPEWIGHTFDKKHENILADVAYVCANPHGETVIEDAEYIPQKHDGAVKRFYRYGSWNTVAPENLGRLERLWTYLDEDDIGHDLVLSKPDYVTDRAISLGRNYDFDRMILHYMQPHYPYISHSIKQGRDVYNYEERPSRVREHGFEKVFHAYLDDLRYGLDSVEVLLNNLDAERVIITADHGEAFGEYGKYGHGPGMFIPQVRRVPWAETSAKDRGSYTPELERNASGRVSVEERLQALGYK